MPDVFDAMPNLMDTADIDLRDGFPIHFFDADFVITTEPVQIHHREEDQAVVAKLSELVTRTPLARHSKLINETSLYPAEDIDYRVTLKVYEKISPFDKSDIDFVDFARNCAASSRKIQRLNRRGKNFNTEQNCLC